MNNHQSGHQEFISQLLGLVSSGKDGDAKAAFSDYYSQNSLVKSDGDDTELGNVCNAVAHGILHRNREWDREVAWWQSIIETMEEYDRAHSVELHKGLPNHNIVLPLLELNRPEIAVRYLERAISEDMRTRPNNYKNDPAYKLGCFLIPIVKSGKWRDNDQRLPEGERSQLIRAFEEMYRRISHSRRTIVATNVLQNIEDEGLRDTLFTRYRKINQYTQSDPTIVVIYAGSIIEGLLGELLQREADHALASFREVAEQDSRFVFYNHPRVCELWTSVIDTIAPPPETVSNDQKRISINRWAFNQKIKIGQRLGLFGGTNTSAFFILCHLLRQYGNVIHPSLKDTLGVDEEWGVTFQVDTSIAEMILTALEITLSLIGAFSSREQGENEVFSQDDSGIITTASGVLNSLVSPGQPGSFDSEGRFIPVDGVVTQSHTNTSPVMGSTTSSTTTS